MTNLFIQSTTISGMDENEALPRQTGSMVI